MNRDMHVEVRELSPAMRKVLNSVSYGARDIRVIPAFEVEAQSAGGAGQRSFVTIVNLDSGEFQTVNGAWGGANIFTNSPVDLGDEKIPIPANGAVVKGTRGYPRTFATIYAHPDTMGYFLASGDEETLTDEEQQAIYCHAAIKGGEYRRDELRRRRVSQAAIDSLVERGYLKRNKAGAVQITTKGKNARTVQN